MLPASPVPNFREMGMIPLSSANPLHSDNHPSTSVLARLPKQQPVVLEVTLSQTQHQSASWGPWRSPWGVWLIYLDYLTALEHQAGDLPSPLYSTPCFQSALFNPIPDPLRRPESFSHAPQIRDSQIHSQRFPFSLSLNGCS